jgi:hypothetical protein
VLLTILAMVAGICTDGQNANSRVSALSNTYPADVCAHSKFQLISVCTALPSASCGVVQGLSAGQFQARFDPNS